MRAADKEAELRTAPAHTFTLPPGAWATSWEERPTEPVEVGLRRLSSHERSLANVEAIARADRAMPKDRRSPDDPLWLQAWEIAFVHYLLGMALCHPQDARRPLWATREGVSLQDGTLLLADAEGGKPGAIPLVSRRFSDAGIVRCYDELEVVERLSGAMRRPARDGELARFGAALADGSLLAALRAHPSDDARAVEAHLRVLLAQAIDLVANGRESPHPAAS